MWDLIVSVPEHLFTFCLMIVLIFVPWEQGCAHTRVRRLEGCRICHYLS